jgi:hypothetical protein
LAGGAAAISRADETSNNARMANPSRTSVV